MLWLLKVNVSVIYWVYLSFTQKVTLKTKSPLSRNRKRLFCIYFRNTGYERQGFVRDNVTSFEALFSIHRHRHLAIVGNVPHFATADTFR